MGTILDKIYEEEDERLEKIRNRIVIDETVCPDWIIAGLTFKSIWFKGYIKVLSVDISRNKMLVEINFAGSNQSCQEDWDLQISIWAFEKREYYRVFNN